MSGFRARPPLARHARRRRTKCAAVLLKAAPNAEKTMRVDFEASLSTMRIILKQERDGVTQDFVLFFLDLTTLRSTPLTNARWRCTCCSAEPIRRNAGSACRDVRIILHEVYECASAALNCGKCALRWVCRQRNVMDNDDDKWI